MLRHKLIIKTCNGLQKRSFAKSSVRWNKKSDLRVRVEKIRNIGILAHIDAGKTTTTERMLYYSGMINHMGEVHHGNTVTDYMEQERKRGITITSAAVTFPWKGYRFNLIDTPGHIDFTMGVEQTLGVLDGAVVVLDGSAGVEPQTMTVWKQADRYNIARLVYVNKMDRADADFDMSLKSIESRLDCKTLPVQFPIKVDNELRGIVDVVSLEKWLFDKKDQGKVFEKVKLSEEEDAELLSFAEERRRELTDRLSGLDDELANFVIERSSLEDVESNLLLGSLRRVTVNRKGVPVLLGSSYKNIGVQPLMDAVILYLPQPGQSKVNKQYRCFGTNLAAKVFKIVHDKQKGALAFARIYSGRLQKGQKMYNIQRQVSETCNRLYIVNADEYQEVNEIEEGNIAALAGFKSTITGDLMTTSALVANDANKLMVRSNAEDVDGLFKAATNIPQPVFFCSIEPPSMAYQIALDNALAQLEKEDPSLRVKVDPDTGQTVLAGMGELHIDIIKERIRSEYKIDVDLGELQIAYKETINQSMKEEFDVKHDIAGSIHSLKIILSVIHGHEGSSPENPVFLLDTSPECNTNLKAIHPKVMKAVESGVAAAFINGPKMGCPVIDVAVKLHWLEVGKRTSNTIVSASVTQGIKKVMKKCDAVILEPIMNLEVVALQKYSTNVVSDLDRRRAEIKEVFIRGQNKIVSAFVPLSELLGYATSLRIACSGNATFTMEFSHYRAMDPYEEREAIKKITGF